MGDAAFGSRSTVACFRGAFREHVQDQFALQAGLGRFRIGRQQHDQAAGTANDAYQRDPGGRFAQFDTHVIQVGPVGNRQLVADHAAGRES